MLQTIAKSLVLGLVWACGAPAATAALTSGTVYPSDAAPIHPASGSAGLLLAEELPPRVHFALGTDAMLPGEPARLVSWAASLNRPELAHTTVVLAGGDEPDGPPGLFAARAERIRAALVARGVEPARIVVVTPPVALLGPSSGTVRLALTWSETVREIAPASGGQGRGRSLP